MLKELLAVGSVVASGGLLPTRNYQHTEIIDNNVEVTYKYETNEVNSVDDIVLGNLYYFDFENDFIDGYLLDTSEFYFNFIYLESYDFHNLDSYFIDEYIDQSIIFDDNTLFGFGITQWNMYLLLPINNNNDSIFSILYEDVGSTAFSIKGYGYFTYIDLSSSDDAVPFISATDYNVIESVQKVQSTTLVGVINDFCEDYLFTEIPYVNDITFTVGGQQITLMTYLVIFVGIVLGIGILILLFYLFKWLFFLFAGCFKPR